MVFMVNPNKKLVTLHGGDQEEDEYDPVCEEKGIHEERIEVRYDSVANQDILLLVIFKEV